MSTGEELQAALERLAEDPEYKDKIIVLPLRKKS
jgi:hypothetical protein